jgi:chromosome partitioning protein
MTTRYRGTVALANHKGGVGKSVSAVNLSGALALAGRRVLLVDVDSQAHATLWFMSPEDVGADLEDVVVRGMATEAAILTTRIEGLDLCRQP